MRRRLMLAALVLGLVLLAGRFLATPRKSSPAPAREIVFTREAAPAPYSAAEGPAAELQSLLDSVSQAALAGDWQKAVRTVQDLQRRWETLQPLSGGGLQMEEEIASHLQALQQAVWARNQQAVLQAGGELTKLLGRLKA